MKIYYECGEGWYPLIETFKRLAESATLNKNITPVVITQIKEKFGELRIYYVGGDKRVDGYAEFACAISRSICEVCGAPATTKSKNGWIKTTCDEHV